MGKLAQYQPQDLKSVIKKPEDIAHKAAKILKDEKVDPDVRRIAAEALGNLGAAGAKYASDIAKILKDENVDADVRHNAAEALGNIKKLEIKEVFVVLNYVYEPNTPDIQNTW